MRIAIGGRWGAGDAALRRGRRASTGGAAAAVLIALLLSVVTAAPAYAHLALRSGEPGDGAALTTVPRVIRLSFTEPVELGLSSITLTGPSGVVSLGALTADGDARDVVTAEIVDDLEPGSYTVEWQAVGRDGHPVRGEYGFTIEEGAEGLPVPEPEAAMDTAVAAPPAEIAPAPQQPTFTAESPLYAGVRWLGYLGILGSIGALGFGLLLTRSRLTGSLPGNVRAAALTGTAAVGLLSASALLISLPLRLQAQSHALFGAGIDADRFGLIVDTLWGRAWLLQAAAVVLLFAGFLLARRSPGAGLLVAGLGALAVAASPGMSGHAAAVAGVTGLAIASDALHLLGAGLWLGTLLVLFAIGLPIVRTLAPGEKGRVLFEMVNAFSPLALGAAALVVLTGLAASVLHLTGVSDLWGTPYGRLLLAKLFLVGIVFAAGAFNWRRLTPSSDAPEAADRLRGSAAIELTAALLVVGLTSFLVAVPPPAHAADDTAATPIPTALP